MKPAIVVLTPLKNDAWILRRFLSVTSLFADRIVIADQGSVDGGPDLCREYEKVTVVPNPHPDYDEAARQRLLIATARALVPSPRILMALDADEVMAADAVESPGWQRMLSAPPGTVVYCEKPNLYLSVARVERRPRDFPLAFVDDGSPHRPLRIHSPRLPVGNGSPDLVLDDVVVLHFALTRPAAQKAKFRMYSVLENVMGTKSWYWRRRYYWSRRVLAPSGPVEPTPATWLAGWERRGIDMTTIEDTQPYWQDLVALEHLLRHGSLRFWLDDVWERDWAQLVAEQKQTGRLFPPPRLLRAALDAAQTLLELAAAAKRRRRHRVAPHADPLPLV